MTCKHKHQGCCEHQNVKYCKCCHKVYCEDCGKEWSEPTTWIYNYNKLPYTWTYPNGDLTSSSLQVNTNTASKCSHS